MSQPDRPHSDSSSSESSRSDNPVFQRLEELDRRISSTVEGLFQDLNQEIRTRIDDVSRWVEEKGAEIPTSWLDDLKEMVESKQGEEAPTPVASPIADTTADLLQAVVRIDDQTDQPSVLRSLTDETGRFAGQTALFLIRQGQVRGWACSGLGREAVEAAEAALTDAPFDDLASADSAIVLDAEQATALGELVGQASVEAVLVPLTIRGDLVGALYAARSEEDGPIAAPAIQLLAHGAVMALETLQVSAGPSPTLRLRGELSAPSIEIPQDEPVVEELSADVPVVEELSADVPVVEELSAEEPAAEELPVEEPAVEEPAVDVAGETAGVAEAESVAEAEPIAEEPAIEVPAVMYGDLTERVDLETTAVPSTLVDDAAGEAHAPGLEVIDDEPIAEDAQPFELGDAVEPVEEVAHPASIVEPEAGYEVDVPADEFASEEPVAAEPEVTDAPSFVPPIDDDFGQESDLPSPEEIAREAAEPEPALEDTNIWELEEEEEDDEPTAVGEAVVDEPVSDPIAAEPEAPEPVAPPMVVPPAFDSGAVGQETVRLDMSALQDHAATMAEDEDPGDATAPSLHLSSPTPEPAVPSAPEIPDAPVMPEVPVAPTVPVAPSAADLPSAPAAPEMPVAPAMPDVPAAPALGAAADLPDPPDVPTAPVALEPVAPEPVAPEPSEPAPSSFFEPPAAAPVAAPPQSFAPETEPTEPAVPAAPASTEVTPPEPEPKADAGGSTEVKPPSDLEGPGRAFRQASSPSAVDDGSEALHEEARRLARLLVSEIKLYNE
ncbi:MAG: hypothetical protein AAGE94_08560, partial [Acidobacteriota bacterium]